MSRVEVIGRNDFAVMPWNEKSGAEQADGEDSEVLEWREEGRDCFDDDGWAMVVRKGGSNLKCATLVRR